MLQFHNESKPSLFDYVLRISVNEKANKGEDIQESPYVTKILYPISDKEIVLPKTFQGIGLFFFTDAKDKYLTKGHPRYELQWKEYSSFSFCLTDEKKNIFFVFAYLHSSSAYCVISDYYHPGFLSDFIYVLSISKNPSEFAQKINNIFIKSITQTSDEEYYADDEEAVFIHDQHDWFIRNFPTENSDSGSASAYSLPLQGPKSTSSSNMSKNSRIQLLANRKMSNLSTAKINISKQADYANHLYGISHINHMSPENEISELYKFIFSDLPVEYILMLIDAILLDYKIIIISNDVSKLGKAAFAIIGLLYPLKWPGSFIPVCPEVMSTFLEAPFPYIIGIHSSLSMKLLEGDNMVYCIYNVDAHYVANIGIEDFPPNVLNYIDLVADKIKTLIHSYSPLFPFVHVQREIRNFIKGTLANSYGLDPADFGYKELMADFVVWRDESSSEYAAYFSQSQTVDHFMRSLENSEYEKDDRVFKAFFPNETFMGTVHIPRQLVEESIEKEKEDGIKINIADLQMLSKSYPKTPVKVNNDRLVSFGSPNSNKSKEVDSPTKKENTNQDQIKIDANLTTTSNASDSESSRKSSSKHKHKHKHHTTKALRSSVPISKTSDLNDQLKEEAVSEYPMKKNTRARSNSNSSSSDSDISIDSNIDVGKIIKSDLKKNKKKYQSPSNTKSLTISTFSTDSASEADASSYISDSEENKRSTKSKRRIPPDLPSIPKKSQDNEAKSSASYKKETETQSRTKKKKDKEEKKTKKSSNKKSNSKTKSETNSESDSKTESESDKKKKDQHKTPPNKTVLVIESDSDVAESSSDDGGKSDDDSGNWGSSSSSDNLPRKLKKKSTENKKTKTPQKKVTNEDDSDHFSSSSSSNQAVKTQPSKSKLKKKKPYNFNSDSESKSERDIKNELDHFSDYDSESDQILQKKDESIRQMMRKSNISDSNDDERSKDDEEKNSFIDSPIPKKKSRYVQESDLASSSSKNKNKAKYKSKNLRENDDEDSNDYSNDSDDFNDPSLKKKYKTSSNVNKEQKKSKESKKKNE